MALFTCVGYRSTAPKKKSLPSSWVLFFNVFVCSVLASEWWWLHMQMFKCLYPWWSSAAGVCLCLIEPEQSSMIQVQTKAVNLCKRIMVLCEDGVRWEVFCFRSFMWWPVSFFDRRKVFVPCQNLIVIDAWCSYWAASVGNEHCHVASRGHKLCAHLFCEKIWFTYLRFWKFIVNRTELFLGGLVYRWYLSLTVSSSL